MSKHTDDWGPALGADPDRPKVEKYKPQKRTVDPNSKMGLINYFESVVPFDMRRIGANVNGPAMMKVLGKVMDQGFTADDIRGMMDAFAKDHTRRPLPPSIAPWRAFLANIDRYAHKARRAPTREETHEPEIDPRLQDD